MFFFFKQKTAYEMRISDWSSDVCSSDLEHANGGIDEEAGEGDLRPPQVALEEVVGQSHRAAQVAQEVAHRVAHHGRHDVAVGHRQRAHHPEVQSLVEGEENAVRHLESAIVVRLRAKVTTNAAGQQPNGKR